MTCRINIQTGIRAILLYLINAVIIIRSACMYALLTNSPLYNRGVGWILALFCATYVLSTKRIKLNKTFNRLFLVLAVLLIYLIVNSYNAQVFLKSYVSAFICFFIVIIAFYQNGDLENFMKAFSNIMLVISVISLFFYFFGTVLDVLPSRTFVTYDWADAYLPSYTYYYLYFENPVQNIGRLCNLGIFTEAPGYSGFLTYALLIEVILRKKITEPSAKRISTTRIFVFVITMFTTASTKGIIAVLIVMAIEYLTRDTKGLLNKFIMITGSIILIAALTAATSILLESKLMTGSGNIRMDDFQAGIKTFMSNPLFGVGFENNEAILRNAFIIRSNMGLGMGLTTLLACGGVWLFSIYVGALYFSFNSPYFKENKKNWFLIISILGYNLLISNSGFSQVYIFLLAAAYASPVKRTNTVAKKGFS